MKSATWGFNLKKILNTFLKAHTSIFYFFEVIGIKKKIIYQFEVDFLLHIFIIKTKEQICSAA